MGLRVMVACGRMLSNLFELDADTDFFALLDLQLAYSAITLKSRLLVARLLFRLYQLLLPLQYAIWLSRIWVVSAIEHDATLAMSLSCGAFAITTMMIRYGLMLMVHDKFGAVRAYINSRRFLRGHPVAHELRRRAYRTNNYMLLLLHLYGLINIVIFAAFDVQQHEIFRIPDYIRRRSEPLFWFMHLAMLPLVLNGLASYMAGFHNLNALMIGLRAEFQLVQYAFERTLQSDPSTREDWHWYALNHDLGICVREHGEILRHLRAVQQHLSFSMTAQYYTALLSLAFDSFFISYNGFDLVTCIVVTFSVLLVFEWYYCCKLVEDIQAIHVGIGWTLYNDDWPSRLGCTGRITPYLHQFRTSLSIILAVCQRSLSFHGSGIVEVSWQAFGDLFKTSYSVLMFLIELRKVNRAK